MGYDGEKFYWDKIEHLLCNVYKQVSVDSDKDNLKILKEHVKEIYVNEKRKTLCNTL